MTTTEPPPLRESTRRPRPGLREVAVVVALLTIQTVLLVGGACAKSATYDEWSHLAGGLRFLETGGNEIHPDTPAGAKIWIAWPVRLVLDPELPVTDDVYPWAYGDRLRDGLARPGPALLLARLPVVALALALAAAAYALARGLWGRRAGLLALAIIVFEPNLLAHGRVAGGDVPLAALAIGALACLRQLIRNGRRRWLFATAMLLALALETKFVAAALVPLFALTVVANDFARGKARRSPRAAVVSALWLVGATVLLYAGLVFLIYGGPAPVVAGYRAVFAHVGTGHPTFLLGETSTSGWWYYYPVVWLVKTPLPILLAIAALPWLLVRPPIRRRLLFLTVPAAGWFLLAVSSSVCLGVRHILFVVGCGAVLVSAWATGAALPRPGVRRVVALGAVIWLAVSTLAAFPNYLSYFNPAARALRPPHRILNDSNLDWGQDLPALAAWLRERSNPPVRMIYFGHDDPRRFGIDARRLAPDVPADRIPPGLLAVSASFRALAPLRPDLERRLIEAEHLATPGGSIFVFRLGP